MTNPKPWHYRVLRIAQGYGKFAVLLLRHIPVWLIAFVRASRAYRKGIRINKEDRVRALVAIRAEGLVYYRGPYSSGVTWVIPAGTVLRVYSDTDERTLFFACTFLNAADERLLLPPSERENSRYGGVAFSFDLSEIGRRLEVLGTDGDRDG